MKKTAISIFAIAFVISTAISANAASWPYNITSLLKYLEGDNHHPGASSFTALKTTTDPFAFAKGQSYSAALLAYEAGWTHAFFGGSGSSSPLFINNSGPYGQFFTVDDITEAYFKRTDDTSPGPWVIGDGSSDSFEMYRLNADWSPPELGVTLKAGTIILGLDDGGGGADDNHDDIILALTKVQVPIPGAIWMLASGLVGLVALRRKHN